MALTGIAMVTVWHQDLLRTHRIGGLTRILGRAPAHLPLTSQQFESSRLSMKPRKCLSGEASSSEGRREEEELLWRDFFRDPILWWDSRQHKKSSRSPDFRRKGSGEALWFKNFYKPAWVDEQLAALDMQMGRGSPTSKSSLPDMPNPGRPARHEMVVAAVSKRTTNQQAEVNLAIEALSGDGSSSEGGRQEQELLWRQFFRDPTLWWDHRQDKTSSRSPDFQHKGSGEVLSLNNKYKPTWVDEQLVALDIQVGRGAPTSNPSLLKKPEPGRPAGYETVVTAVTVSTLCQQGKLTEGVEALEVLVQTDCPISRSLFYTVLKQCVAKKDLVLGCRVHALTVREGHEPDTFLCNHILRMYASHARLQEAMDVFTLVSKPDVFTWCAIISAHVKHGQAKQAIQLYLQMRKTNVKPNGHVFVAALQACARGADLETGQQVHADVLASADEPHLYVVNSLVDMYSKCGSLKEAQRLFDGLDEKDVVTWTAMIAGYSQQGMGQEALHLYSAMQEQGTVAPNSVTFVCLLQACATVAALPLGKKLHAQIEERGLQGDPVVGTSLVDMYAKCGSMVDAQQVFDGLSGRDIVAWGALIAGYTCLGDTDLVFDSVHRMIEADTIQPDTITFLSVLTVCSHAGLVNKGREYFDAMSRHYGITPTVEHYTCMVDLLGRAGELDEALELVRTMPLQPNDDVWHTLLGACRKWSNVEVGRHAFNEALKLDEKDAAAYVMMCNIYAGAQMHEEAQKMQVRRKEIGAWKEPGQSWWTDMSGIVHAFLVGDKKHPESEGIYARLKQLVAKMKKEGYVPHLDSSLRGTSDVEKEAHLCGHSEKLAIAYALNKTPEGTTIRIVKNLRVCEDCHMATAYISKIEKRTIICRDASRFHVYKEGKCSCGDYW